MIPFLDLTRQYRSIQSEIDAAIAMVLERGHFILGEQVAAFEEEFAAYCGVRYASGVGSGTEALHLALRACGIGPGHEVITVPNTAVPTVNAISATGATPVFVDVRPDSYNLDPDRIEASINANSKAILPVHLYGQAADMDPILELAAHHGLVVIEDACQAHGTTYRGRKVGGLGQVGCFSFYPTKNLGAYGDGGMVVTDNPDLAQRVRLMRHHGQTERYHHVMEGYNSRLDELQAAVLRVKLARLEAGNAIRRQRAGLYRELLGESEVTLPQEMSYGGHIYHLFVIRAPRRDTLQEHLAARGIQTLIHYPISVHLQKAYSHLGLQRGAFPVAEGCAEEVLSLPLYPEIAEGEVEEVCRAIISFYR